MSAELLGFNLWSESKESLLALLETKLTSHEQIFLVTANPEILVLAKENSLYRQTLENSQIICPDGSGVLIANRLRILKSAKISQNTPATELITETITGVDLVIDLARIAATKQLKMFLLAGQNLSAEQTASKLKKLFPSLVVQALSQVTITADGVIPESILEQIKSFAPTILLVAAGAPKQEFFINRYLKSLPSVRLAAGVGGSFDYLSGQIKRAPKWLRNFHLEWLFRLIRQPRRLPRIIKAIFTFSKYVWQSFQKN